MTEDHSIPGHDDDPRPDIQQAIEARADAVARGEGGFEPEVLTKTGDFPATPAPAAR